MAQKNPAAKKSMTKSELLNAISNETNLNRREVRAVLDALSAQVSKSLGPRGAAAFTLPGLVKNREEKGSRPPGPQGCAEPVQTWRGDGYRRKAGDDESQSPGAQEPEGHGLSASFGSS